MGQKLVDMYTEAKKIGGFGAQMRLSILTMVASPKAMDTPDTAENVNKFRNALEIIRKESK